MQKKRSKHKQGHLLYPDLLEQLNPKHPLLLLAQNIAWDKFEEEFAGLYSPMGRPAKPVRLMVGLLLLKHLENLSDERVVEAWVQNPYYQAFCGMEHFSWSFPCDPSDLVHFRHRLGEAGVERIFAASVEIHGAKALESEVVVDTTVQEKNITYPTDSKLHSKIIVQCRIIAKKSNIKLRRSFTREIPRLLRTLHYKRHPRTIKQAHAASRRLKTIAGALVRELQRKLPGETLQKLKPRFDLFERVLTQKSKDKNKIYSLHEPQTLCLSKGKVHKKYEFGSKASIAITKNSGLIVAARSFSENIYDGHTLPDTLCQIKAITGRTPSLAIGDLGYRGKKQIEETKILIPGKNPASLSDYAKRQKRLRLKRRSAIEAIIGHLKADFRLARCFLKGFIGDSINLLLAAAAFNLKKWMKAFAFIIFCLLLVPFYCPKIKPRILPT